MGKYCNCATVDSGLIDEVVTLEAARSNVPLGWHILPGSITEDKAEAEKHLKQWKRRPRKLVKQLETRIMY